MAIGDDGAVCRPVPDRDLITAVDTLVAGVHFPDNTKPRDIGYRAVAVNLSDIAAMGARPRWMTLALTLPDVEERWIAEFAAGLHAAAAEHNVVLVGGDTTAGECVVVSVQIIGDIAAGTAVYRSGARINDTIFVTGTVGDAAAGLQLLGEGQDENDLVVRFLRPSPRVGFGQTLPGVASAAIDVSDGLFADLGKLLSASGVGGILQLDCVPISAALRAGFDLNAQRRFALSGGDDYELCFTASADASIVSGEVLVTAVGTVTNQPGLICRDGDNVLQYIDSGYRHFS